MRLNRLRTLTLPIFLLILTAAACDSSGENAVGDAIDADVEPLPEFPRDAADADYVTTDSGLKYHDFVEGDGAEATSGTRVTVHYRGWLTNGESFDASYNRGEPFVFNLGAGRVIAGWDEGVQGMKVGGERQLVVPPSLGYGARSVGSIPPNSTLIFEVQLLGVN